MEGEDLIELKFRLADGTDIGPSKYNSATTVVSLKEKIIAQWPKDKENGPKTVNSVQLINAGKILENHRTIAESRVPVGELPGGVITMHVVLRPTLPDKNSEDSGEDADTDGRTFFNCVSVRRRCHQVNQSPLFPSLFNRSVQTSPSIRTIQLRRSPNGELCTTVTAMPKDPNDKCWRFPDHNNWVRSRINSNSKGQIIQVVKDVLSKCGMLERFKNGPFGHYIDLPQPVIVHGMLIYNLLKKEIIHPKREDEMWFGLGQKKVCFGKEQFCVCSGLKMGPMPEGFLNMKPYVEGHWYTTYFKHRPTPEALESIFSQGMEADGEDLLKMAYILMVCQFFGKDDQRSVVPGWLIALGDNEQAITNFPWGTYIFSMTLFWLDCSTEKRLSRLRGEKKKAAKRMGKMKLKEEDEEVKEINEEEEEEEEEEDNEEEHNEAKGKKDKNNGKQMADVVPKKKNEEKVFTYNVHGFALAFQVWAIETIPRLTKFVGTRIDTGFPRIKNWNFNKKAVHIERNFTSGGISLFNWEVLPKEMETDYYKSLNPDYVCGKLLHKGKVVEVEDVINDEEDVGSDEERDKKLEDPTNINDGDAAFSNYQRTASVMRSSNSISEPPAKKQLFPPKRELQTPKSEIQTSMPSNIAELYLAMAVLIKESEERMTVFCRAEFISIREEMTALHNKVGDKLVVVTTEQHIHPSSNIGSGEKSPSEGTGQSIHSEVAKSEMPDVLVDTGVDAKLDESDLQSKIVDAKLDDTDVLAEGSGEASVLDPDAGVAKTALNTEMDASDVSNAVAQVSAEYMLFNLSEMDEINNSVLLATQQHVPQSKVQVQVKGIVVDDYPSPAVNMLVPNSDESVIALDKADPNVEYKDQDKIRVRKRSRYLGSPWTDPMPKKKKKEVKSAGGTIN